METELLYQSLAEGVYLPKIFPFHTESEFQVLHKQIKVYIGHIPQGCIPALLGFMTGASNRLAKQAKAVAAAAKLEYEDVRQITASIGLISLSANTPEEIHAKLEEGILKGLGNNGDYENTNSRALTLATGFSVLYAAMLWNFKQKRPKK